jgi:hypothetical protein
VLIAQLAAVTGAAVYGAGAIASAKDGYSRVELSDLGPAR